MEENEEKNTAPEEEAQTVPEKQPEAKKKTKKPFYKNWVFWLVAGIVILLIVGIVIGATVDEETLEKYSSYKSEQTEESVVGFNQTVTLGDFEFTALGAYDTKSIGLESTENNYVVVMLQIKNNASTEKTLDDDDFLYYRGNQQYKPANAGIYLSDGLWLNVKIGSGLTKTVSIVYEIPSAYQESDYLLIRTGLLSKQKFYLKYED